MTPWLPSTVAGRPPGPLEELRKVLTDLEERKSQTLEAFPRGKRKRQEILC